jgi:hypothetical protein
MNAPSGAIRVGNLDGSGTPQNLYTGEFFPEGVAVDPAAGKIYWVDAVGSVSPGAIRVGNLDGSGTPQTLFTSEDPFGVAVDPAARKIYWTNFVNGVGGAIRVGNLDGSGTPQNLFAGENPASTGESPASVAIDPAASKIYWKNDGYPNTGIRVGNLDGSGTPSTLFGVGDPGYVALLRSPAGAGAPQVSGGSAVGSVLSCSQGSWASDLGGGFLYRAPRSFAYQWSLNGADIPGATASSYTASTGGSYTCRVTATNQAGSTAQTSTAHTVTGGPSQMPPILPPVAPSLSQVAQSHGRW